MIHSVLDDLTLAQTQSRQKFFSLLNDIFYIGAKLRESNSYKQKVNTISQVLCLFAAPAFGKTKGLWFSKGHKDDARKTFLRSWRFSLFDFYQNYIKISFHNKRWSALWPFCQKEKAEQ